MIFVLRVFSVTSWSASYPITSDSCQRSITMWLFLWHQNHLCPRFVLHRARTAKEKGYFSSLTDIQTNKQFQFKLTRNEQFFNPVGMTVYPYNQREVKASINLLDQTRDFNLCFQSTSFITSYFLFWRRPFSFCMYTLSHENNFFSQ